MRNTPLHSDALSFNKLKDSFGKLVVVVTLTMVTDTESGEEKISKIEFNAKDAITILSIDDTSKKLKFVYYDAKGKVGKRKLKDVHIPVLDRKYWHDSICVLPLDVALALKDELNVLPPRPKMDWTLPSTSKQLIGLSS